MAFEFKLPDIGEGVVEGEVVKWKVREGEVIKLDQPMVEIMTDKATVEIPAPRAGKVERLMIAEGKICAVGQVLIVIDDGRAGTQPTGQHAAATHSTPTAQVPAAAGQVHPPKPPPASASGNGKSVPVHMATQMAANVPDDFARGASERVLATPATRKLARELGVDLFRVRPTGPNGRVTSDDVRRGVQAPASQPQHARSQPVTLPPPAAAPAYTPSQVATSEGDTRVPFRGVRKAIAANLARSKQTAAHFTYVEEIDVTDLVRLRGRAKERAAQKGVKLTYLPFIVKAACEALKKWPSINASLDESAQEIVYKKSYHIGIATQGPQGLSVGVIRDADKKGVYDLAREIERVSVAIRDGKATREELTGSTFTISSLGQLGGVLATPIINFPESAIMGVHKIAEKPAVVNGQIAVRSLMNLSISVDHRIADGYDGAMMLQEVKLLLEEPSLMFMENL
jgi:pyruvate dehydrogenase E2 component (dihydrolipoamide acetyltransferase)